MKDLIRHGSVRHQVLCWFLFNITGSLCVFVCFFVFGGMNLGESQIKRRTFLEQETKILILLGFEQPFQVFKVASGSSDGLASSGKQR